MENVAFLTRKKLTMEKFSTQVKISTENPIKKILSVDANSVISSCDILNGTISLTGKIKVNLLFVNKLDSIDHSEMFFDFIEKQQSLVELTDIFADDKVTLKSVSFSNTEAIFVFEHIVCLNGNYNYEIPLFSDENKDFVVKDSNFDSHRFVTSAEDNFVVAEETEVNITNASILSCNAGIIISEVNCLVDKISIEGKILSTILYNDLDSIETYSREFEFRQEIQANGVLPNMTVCANASIKNVTVTIEENDSKTNLVYAFDVYARGMIYEDYTYETIEDMFSLNNNLQTTYDYIEARTYSNMKNLNDTVMLSEDISKLENFDDVSQICFPKFKLESIDEGEEKAILSGVLTSTVIYKTTDDYNSFETNLPVKLEILKESSESVGEVQVCPEVSSFKVKAGKYLEVIYSLNYQVYIEKNVSKKYVKAFEIQSNKQANEGGIKVYITKKGETLFDIAKSLNVRPETITSQNEILDNFEQGEKIYIYSPVNLLN